MARFPKYQPSEAHRREVLAMTGFGILQNDIAQMLEIDPKTLRKHYRRELDTGVTQANARVAQTLYLMATKEKNVAACIWWTKCRMGWKSASGDDKADTPLVVDFRWADQVTPAVTAPQAPIIEAVAEAVEADAPEITWANEAA
jgi:hypothetical protein